MVEITSVIDLSRLDQRKSLPLEVRKQLESRTKLFKPSDHAFVLPSTIKIMESKKLSTILSVDNSEDHSLSYDGYSEDTGRLAVNGNFRKDLEASEGQQDKACKFIDKVNIRSKASIYRNITAPLRKSESKSEKKFTKGIHAYKTRLFIAAVSDDTESPVRCKSRKSLEDEMAGEYDEELHYYAIKSLVDPKFDPNEKFNKMTGEGVMKYHRSIHGEMQSILDSKYREGVKRYIKLPPGFKIPTGSRRATIDWQTGELEANIVEEVKKRCCPAFETGYLSDLESKICLTVLEDVLDEYAIIQVRLPQICDEDIDIEKAKCGNWYRSPEERFGDINFEADSMKQSSETFTLMDYMRKLRIDVAYIEEVLMLTRKGLNNFNSYWALFLAVEDARFTLQDEIDMENIYKNSDEKLAQRRRELQEQRRSLEELLILNETRKLKLMDKMDNKQRIYEVRNRYVQRWEKARYEQHQIYIKRKEQAIEKRIQNVLELIQNEKLRFEQMQRLFAEDQLKMSVMLQEWDREKPLNLEAVQQSLLVTEMSLRDMKRAKESLETLWTQRDRSIRSFFNWKLKLDAKQAAAKCIQHWWRSILFQRATYDALYAANAAHVTVALWHRKLDRHRMSVGIRKSARLKAELRSELHRKMRASTRIWRSNYTTPRTSETPLGSTVIASPSKISPPLKRRPEKGKKHRKPKHYRGVRSAQNAWTTLRPRLSAVVRQLPIKWKVTDQEYLRYKRRRDEKYLQLMRIQERRMKLLKEVISALETMLHKQAIRKVLQQRSPNKKKENKKRVRIADEETRSESTLVMPAAFSMWRTQGPLEFKRRLSMQINPARVMIRPNSKIEDYAERVHPKNELISLHQEGQTKGSLVDVVKHKATVSSRHSV